MFKVCAAEIKKILSRPGIYILSLLLAVILVVGAIGYKPEVTKDTSITLQGTTFEEKYNAFIGDNATYGEKLKADKIVNDAVLNVKNYTVSSHYGEVSTYDYIIGDEDSATSLKAKFDSKLNSYRNDYSNNATSTSINTHRKEVQNALKELYQAIQSNLNKGAAGSYTIVTTNSNNEKFNSLYNEVYSLFSVNADKAKIAEISAKYDKEYKKDFEKTLNQFYFPTLSKNTIKTYTLLEEDTKYTILQTRLNDLTKTINETLELSKTEKVSGSEMDDLANEYFNICNTYSNLIKYELVTNAFDSLSATEQMDVLYLKDVSKYNSDSLLMRYDYLFEHNKTENDFAKPLTIGTTSNTETNAYDYAYFVLRVFSFVIIIFACMTACHSIAGETKEGTMRYFAIRPVSRNEIFFGKFLAIVTLSFILTIFSGIIALCVGAAFYGLASSPILTIFNGSHAITLAPIGMLGLFLLSLLLELIVYTAIALMLSSLLKSDLLAITIIMILYLLNILLPVFINGFNTWLSFYPFAHISLFSLFGSSVFAPQGNFFNILLGAKVYTTTALPLTLMTILIITALTCALTMFRLRDKEF